MIELTKIPAKERLALERKYGKNIRVCRKEYKIIYCKNLKFEGRPCAGLCYPDETSIFIDIEADDVILTLLHEVIHAECSEMGIRQCPGWTQDMEEMLAENLSQGLNLAYNLTRKKEGKKKHGNRK